MEIDTLAKDRSFKNYPLWEADKQQPAFLQMKRFARQYQSGSCRVKLHGELGANIVKLRNLVKSVIVEWMFSTQLCRKYQQNLCKSELIYK